MNKTNKIIGVDIDGYIADPLDKKDRHKYWLSKPRKDMIEKVNKLYENRNIIIYHTGRAPIYYTETFAWLIKNGCKFHALRMAKLNADFFLDDKNANIEDLL